MTQGPSDFRVTADLLTDPSHDAPVRPIVPPEDLEALRGSDLFDAEWYRAQNPDVDLLGVDPAAHYLWLGHRLGRNPSLGFDARAYLATNDDVARTGIDPLLHYLRWGREEGRWPTPVRRPAARPRRLRPKALGRRSRPTLNWVMNPDNVGWAYGNNARALAALMPEFEHVFDGVGTATDAALFFDIRVFQMRGRSAAHNVLRVGGPRPIELAYGGDLDRLRVDLRAFDAVIVLNRALLATLAPLHPNVRLVPNALDLDAWEEEAGPPALAPRPFVAGFAGNLQTAREREIKGFDLVEAACAASGVPLVWFGKGRDQIPREKMGRRFFRAIDCLVHPVGPGKEGCSNVIMEALALGVPVIATRDAGYHAELIEDGEGLLYCARDASSIAACLARLRQDEVLREAMRAGGRRFARLHHDVRRTAPVYARLLTPPDFAAGEPVVEFVPFWTPPGRFASSRLRCAQPAALLEDSRHLRPRLAADGVPEGEADAVVVSQLASDATVAALGREPEAQVVYDVCDRYFDDDRAVGGVPAKARFFEMAARADVITASTVALKREVAGLGLGKPVVYLPDGIDYRGTREPSPTDPAGPALWFGNPGRGNFDSARWMIDHVLGRGDPVRLVSRRGHFLHLARTTDAAFAAYAEICDEWREEGFVAALRASGVCLLATSAAEPAKSPNRLVTAVMNGVPAVVSGMPAAAGLLRAAGLGWAVVDDADGLDAALARLREPAERRRYLRRMQDLVEAELGDDAIRGRYEALARDHLAPRTGRGTGSAGRGTRPPRVLFVSHNLSHGEGAPTSLLQTVTGLKAAHGVAATLFSVLPGALEEAYAAQGVPVVVADTGFRGRLASRTIARRPDEMADAFRATVEEVRPDLVVANTATALWFAGLAEEMGLPTVSIIRESLPEHVELAFGPPEVMDACREGLTRTRRVVFVSGHTRRLWAGRHDLGDAATVIPNGIDLSPFDAARARDREEVRRDLGVPPGDLLLLSVGSINPRKSQLDIVEALALLPPDLWGRVRLALVGAKPSSYLDALGARMAGLDPALASRIRVEPETHDIGTWYRAADLFVFASRNESYPRVIVEAMSFGLPVVSSAVFGTKEQIVDGESGLLFPPGDVPALAQHLGRLIRDEAGRAALGEAAGMRAWELVTYWEMVHRYAVLIRRVLAEAA